MKAKQLLAVAALSIAAGTAMGGASTSIPVDVDLFAGFALGNQLSAKVSANDTEFIGCGTRTFDDGLGNVFVFGFCQAEDAGGDRIFCSTENPRLISALNSITAYGFITFRWREIAPDTFECISVGLSTQSVYLPDKKAK